MTTPFITQTADCILSATANHSADVLNIHYELVNTTIAPIYLFNKLAKKGGRSVFEIDPNTVNVVLQSNGVVVGKALVPVPNNREVERQYVPCLSRVEPGEKVVEHLVLSSPISPFTWYEGRLFKSNPQSCPLTFELGYALASEQVDSLIELLDTPYGHLYAANWYPLDLQKIIATDLSIETLVFLTR